MIAILLKASNFNVCLARIMRFTRKELLVMVLDLHTKLQINLLRYVNGWNVIKYWKVEVLITYTTVHNIISVTSGNTFFISFAFNGIFTENFILNNEKIINYLEFLALSLSVSEKPLSTILTIWLLGTYTYTSVYKLVCG